MNYQPTDFRTALDLDLTVLQMNERTLGERMGVTQQAISKWRKRGFPPAYRWEQLKEILGPGSYTARLQFADLARAGLRLRVEAPVNVPPVPESVQGNRTAAPARSLEELQDADDAWLRVLGMLPAAIRPAAPRTTLHAGCTTAVVDYAGPRLALDFVVSPRPHAPANISQPLLKLAALRAGDPSLRVVLCLLAPEGAEAARLRIGYGSALGVETWVLSSEAEAAQRIAQAVLDSPEPPDRTE